jgi:hypothetical protein
VDLGSLPSCIKSSTHPTFASFRVARRATGTADIVLQSKVESRRRARIGESGDYQYFTKSKKLEIGVCKADYWFGSSSARVPLKQGRARAKRRSVPISPFYILPYHAIKAT